MVEHLACLAALNDLSVMHDQHLVCDGAGNCQVVRDEQIGDAEFLVELGEQVEDLRADRDIERGDRLVGDDQFRPGDDGAGDGQALALAAGKFYADTCPCRGDRGRPRARRGSPSRAARRASASSPTHARVRRQAFPPSDAGRRSRKDPGTRPACRRAGEFRFALAGDGFAAKRIVPAVEGSSARIMRRASTCRNRSGRPTPPTGREPSKTRRRRRRGSGQRA